MSLSHTPYLIRHPQSSHFWFRRRVPQHLRPALGRTEIRVSLQTPIPHDAVQRCRLTANIVDKLFAEAETRNERIGDELAAQLQTLRSEFGDPDSPNGSTALKSRSPSLARAWQACRTDFCGSLRISSTHTTTSSYRFLDGTLSGHRYSALRRYTSI